MGTFVYIGRDGPRGAELRKTVRERHLGHIEALDREGRIHYAGPLRDEADQPCGSVIVFEAEGLVEARGIAEGDPYKTEGVFGEVEVYASTAVFPKPRA